MTPIRPVDAASILLLDRSQENVRVLVGRRSSRHVFMPDVYVFPGGRRDASDRLVPIANPLHPLASERLAIRSGARSSDARLRALGVAAVRELFEETGLSVGTPAPKPTALPFLPDLSQLRFLARAITPTGNIRRYDARFFALFADEAGIDPQAIRSSEELEDLRWVDIFHRDGINLPDITVLILEELVKSLQEDTSLPFGRSAPLFTTQRGRLIRDLL